MSKTKPKKLLDANMAVESYLDNLLQEATEPEKILKPPQEVAEHHNVHVLETPLTTAKNFTKEDVFQVLKEEVHEDIEQQLQVEDAKISIKDQFEYPVQCLMFKVKEHLLAIPLIHMGSVVPFGDRLTQLPYSPSYFKGMLKYRDKNVKVADTASLLLNTQQNSDNNEDFSPSHLLVFEREDWAISCDEILDVVTLEEDDIKWHTGEGRLSLGTIKTSLALILNPDAITKKLIKTEKFEEN